MDIKTGYFAQYRKYNKAEYMLVGITRFPPKRYEGLNLPELAPKAETLSAYKNGRISWEEFEKAYLDYLNNNYESVLKALKCLEVSGCNRIVLCCFEKSSEPCHRHILANYLNKNYGYSISEFNHS